MKLVVKHIAVLFFLSFGLIGSTQTSDPEIMSFDDFMEVVKEHHPISKQAGLQTLKGQAYLQKTRGLFDPKLFSDLSQKYYKDEQYFSHLNYGLAIPTWFGIELKASLEQNQGVFLNPEMNVPESGLLLGGISLPLGQGLFIDERRAELRSAQLFTEITEAEGEMILLDLYLRAGLAYWNWFESYYQMQTFLEGVELAQTRFEAVKLGVESGEYPGIDSVEAKIQVQNRTLSYNNALLNFQNSSAQLSIFLWLDGLFPLEVGPLTVPEDIETLALSPLPANINQIINDRLENHPLLRSKALKIDQIGIQERWAKEQLKPQLDITYNALTESAGNETWEQYSLSNYKWGFNFNIPVFLRKERGNLELIQIKENEAILDLNNKNAELTFKFQMAVNDWTNSVAQLDVSRQNVSDYLILLNGERQKFTAGESSLFLVNSREVNYLNARIKLIELTSKNKIARIKTNYAIGNVNFDL